MRNKLNLKEVIEKGYKVVYVEVDGIVEDNLHLLLTIERETDEGHVIEFKSELIICDKVLINPKELKVMPSGSTGKLYLSNNTSLEDAYLIVDKVKR